MKRIFIIFYLIIIANFILACNLNKNENKSNEIKKINIKEQKEVSKNMKKVKMIVKNKEFEVILNNSKASDEFYKMLPLEIDMEDVNGNEKFTKLSKKFTQEVQNPKQINNGDIMLYGSNGLVVFYETFSTIYSYTPLGKIENPSELKEVLGNGNVKIKFEK